MVNQKGAIIYDPTNGTLSAGDIVHKLIQIVFIDADGGLLRVCDAHCGFANDPPQSGRILLFQRPQQQRGLGPHEMIEQLLQAGRLDQRRIAGDNDRRPTLIPEGLVAHLDGMSGAHLVGLEQH